VSRRGPVRNKEMDILSGPIVKAKLEISGEKQVFVDVVAVRKYPVTAVVGKFKPDNLPLLTPAVLPDETARRVRGSRQQYRVTLCARASQLLFGCAKSRRG